MSHEPVPAPHGDDPYATGLPVLAEIPGVESAPSAVVEPTGFRLDRVLLPLALFLATCYSTYIAGASGSLSFAGRAFGLGTQVGRVIDGLIYMAAVMGILFAHEMGHFLQALRYRVPASLPFFIPMPFSPIGTMGAVISMHGSRADRKQLFDIGLSGPLAGLLVAIPITMVGVWIAAHTIIHPNRPSDFADPLIFQALIKLLRPELPANSELYMNPLLMAGWVGMLITGLNMLPVSQLDGGHVIYALFGPASRWIARGFLLFSGAYIVISGNFTWTLMFVLVTLIGCDHPPTANDRVKLGPLRWSIGLLSSISIPILCFMPNPFPALMP
ncbi:MAG: site-2 protease family protein [Pirellulales bacterium]|nr:site-2 protease family protein [Pirellulales bacterium]